MESLSYLVLIPVAVLGWVVGAVINYLSDVLPRRRRLEAPFCLNCQVRQPQVNYWLWPRRCPSCGSRRPWRIWAVELIFLIIVLWLWFVHPNDLGFWGGLFVLAYFGLVVVIDVEHRLILHPVSLVGAVAGLGIGSWLHGVSQTLLGGAVGYGVMFLLYGLGALLLRLAARARGQVVDDEALGFGDVNLGGVLGLFLGFPAIVVGLFLAVFLGGTVSLVYLVVMLLVRKYRLFTALPYGPFLIGGALLVLFFRGLLAAIFK